MSTFQRLILLLSLILTFIVSQAFAKVSKEKVINDIIKKLKKINSYEAEFLMKTVMMNKEVETTGRILFKKPLKYKIEKDVPAPTGKEKMKQLTICDGKIIWSYMPEMKMATKIVIDKLDKKYKDEVMRNYQIGIEPAGYFKKDEIKAVKVDKLNNEKVYIVEVEPRALPRGPASPFTLTLIKVWVGAKDGFTRKLVMYTEEGEKILSMEFRNIKLNIKLKDEIFQFTPRADCQVTDITKSTENMIKQMQKERR